MYIQDPLPLCLFDEFAERVLQDIQMLVDCDCIYVDYGETLKDDIRVLECERDEDWSLERLKDLCGQVLSQCFKDADMQGCPSALYDLSAVYWELAE